MARVVRTGMITDPHGAAPARPAIDPAEYDFSGVSDAELECCRYYEFMRESEAIVGEVNKEAYALQLTGDKLAEAYKNIFAGGFTAESIDKLNLEKVKLKFTKGAILAIAKQALARKAGARGLRAIMENIMLDIMYDIPSKDNIEEVMISEEVVMNKEKPIIVYRREAESA